MAEHYEVCRVRFRVGPELTANTKETPYSGRPQPSRQMSHFGLGSFRELLPYEAGQPTHQWVRFTEIPENAFKAQRLEAAARAHAADLFEAEEVQLSRIWLSGKYAAVPAAPASGPILLTIVRLQRRFEDGEHGGEWPDHRTPGNAAYEPDNDAAAAAVKDALAKSQTSISARILEVFV